MLRLIPKHSLTTRGCDIQYNVTKQIVKLRLVLKLIEIQPNHTDCDVQARTQTYRIQCDIQIMMLRLIPKPIEI